MSYHKGHFLVLAGASVVLALTTSSCRWHGEKSIVTRHDGGELSTAEFENMFANEKLFSYCAWYCGKKDGFHFIRLDRPESIDEYDDMLNRRTRTDSTRYRVRATEIVFSKERPFEGYENGLRVVAPRFEDDSCVSWSKRE
jgi:hypothetical protein